LPLAEGHLADRIGVQHAFIIPAVCYVYIAIFGIAAISRPSAMDAPHMVE
jgi:FHS family L-fucose permease-like MFS transporter